jgi:hypothetical protein
MIQVGERSVELDEFGLPMAIGTHRDSSPPGDHESDTPTLDELVKRFNRLKDSPKIQTAPPPELPIPLATSSKTNMQGDGARPKKDVSDLRKKIDCLLLECDDFDDAATGQTLFGEEKEGAKALVEKISRAIEALHGIDPVADAERVSSLRRYRSSLKRKLIDSAATTATPPLSSNDSRSSTKSATPSASSQLQCDLAVKQIRYELRKLSTSRMPDVRPGVEVNPDDLKDWLKVVVPDIRNTINRLRDSVKSYVN